MALGGDGNKIGAQDNMVAHVTLGDIRSLLRVLSVALSDDEQSAQRLSRATDSSLDPVEELLLMRESLVITRPVWERLDDPALVGQVRRTLAAAKSLAVAT